MSLRIRQRALQRSDSENADAAQCHAEKLYEGPNDAKGDKIFPGLFAGVKSPEDGNLITGQAQARVCCSPLARIFLHFVYGKAD